MFEWILKKIRKDNKGFTLIELVVVIAILAILAAIAIPRFGGFTAGAKEGAVEANHRTIVSAAQMYYANNKEWPEDNGDLGADGAKEHVLFKDGYLAQNDFKKPEATYSIETVNGKCTIKAVFNEKQWIWDSEDGFTKRGNKETKDDK